MGDYFTDPSYESPFQGEPSPKKKQPRPVPSAKKAEVEKIRFKGGERVQIRATDRTTAKRGISQNIMRAGRTKPYGVILGGNHPYYEVTLYSYGGYKEYTEVFHADDMELLDAQGQTQEGFQALLTARAEAYHKQQEEKLEDWKQRLAALSTPPTTPFDEINFYKKEERAINKTRRIERGLMVSEHKFLIQQVVTEGVLDTIIENTGGDYTLYYPVRALACMGMYPEVVVEWVEFLQNLTKDIEIRYMGTSEVPWHSDQPTVKDAIYVVENGKDPMDLLRHVNIDNNYHRILLRPSESGKVSGLFYTLINLISYPRGTTKVGVTLQLAHKFKEELTPIQCLMVALCDDFDGQFTIVGKSIPDVFHPLNTMPRILNHLEKDWVVMKDMFIRRMVDVSTRDKINKALADKDYAGVLGIIKSLPERTPAEVEEVTKRFDYKAHEGHNPYATQVPKGMPKGGRSNRLNLPPVSRLITWDTEDIADFVDAAAREMENGVSTDEPVRYYTLKACLTAAENELIGRGYMASSHRRFPNDNFPPMSEKPKEVKARKQNSRWEVSWKASKGPVQTEPISPGIEPEEGMPAPEPFPEDFPFTKDSLKLEPTNRIVPAIQRITRSLANIPSTSRLARPLASQRMQLVMELNRRGIRWDWARNNVEKEAPAPPITNEAGTPTDYESKLKKYAMSTGLFQQLDDVAKAEGLMAMYNRRAKLVNTYAGGYAAHFGVGPDTSDEGSKKTEADKPSSEDEAKF